ncbi:MAG: PAS domain S-box protein [Nitrospirae bacterium]|nr:MAG: PAS domain S-box protein [Nitrospirota bacterium]
MEECIMLPWSAYQAVLEQMAEAVYLRDQEQRLIYLNPAAERLSGWTMEELQRHGTLSREVFDEDCERGTIRTRTGCLLSVRVTVISVKDQGQLWGTLILIRSLVPECEEVARGADMGVTREQQGGPEHAPVLIAQCGRDQRYQFVSRQYADLFQQSPADLVGRHPREVMGGEAYACLEPYIEQALAGSPVEFETSLPHLPGGPRVFHSVYVPERDASGAVVGFVAAISDVTQRKRTEQFLEEQRRVLERVALGDELHKILDQLCRSLEQFSDGMKCSILLLEGTVLRHGAAPSLPESYIKAIDGVPIGPMAGSCGTAAYRRERVVVSDIATDPLWMEYRDLALAHHLRSCWSSPILTPQGVVLGTFAVYYDEPRRPTPAEIELINTATYLASVAIRHEQAKEAVRRSEERFRTLYDDNPTMYFMVTADETILSVNRFGAEQLGYQPEELLGRSILTIVHEDDQDAVSQGLRSAFAKPDGVTTWEFRKVKKNGECMWVRESVRILPAAAAAAAAAAAGPVSLIVCQDVTKEKALQDKLVASEALFRMFMDHLPGPAFIKNADGRHLFVNRYVERTFKLSRCEWYQKTNKDLFPLSIAAQFEGHDQQVLCQGYALQFTEQTEQDGEVRYWWVTKFPIPNEQGRPTLLGGVGLEVTALKTAEQALRRFAQIVSASRSLLALIDRGYRYEAVNQSYLERVEMQSEHMLGRTVEEIHGRECFEQVLKPHIDRCLAGQAVNFKQWFEFPQEGRRYLDGQLSPFFDEHGIVQGVVLEARDITEVYYLEEQRRQGQKLEAIGTLASGIAHDFNNILGAILGFGELALAAGQGDQKIRRYLNEILTAGKRAKDLVQQILLFSRQTETRWSTLDLRSVVQEALRFLRASLPSTIEISHHVGSTPMPVKGDATQIEQVLLNLGTNAEYAMRGQGGHLRVSLDRVELSTHILQAVPHLRPGWYARLRVQDTGQGIAPEILPKIFDPFFTTKEVHEGTGLGLSVVHGIVLAHGGHLTVDSEIGRGTTFTIYFPLLSQSGEDRADEPFGEPPLPRTGKILILDDEIALVRFMQELLETWGFEVVAVTDPTQALDIFRAAPESFTLVLTDQTMPRMTGERMVQTLRAIRPDVPIILCTGYGPVLTDDQAQALGIKVLLRKPFEKAELLAALRTALTCHEEESHWSS